MHGNEIKNVGNEERRIRDVVCMEINWNCSRRKR